MHNCRSVRMCEGKEYVCSNHLTTHSGGEPSFYWACYENIHISSNVHGHHNGEMHAKRSVQVPPAGKAYPDVSSLSPATDLPGVSLVVEHMTSWAYTANVEQHTALSVAQQEQDTGECCQLTGTHEKSSDRRKERTRRV